MSETKLEQSVEEDRERSVLKRALIAFAILEALVLIPIILYKLFG